MKDEYLIPEHVEPIRQWPRSVRYVDVGSMSDKDAEKALCEARGVEYGLEKKSILPLVVYVLAALAWISLVVIAAMN